jgi:diaminopimelate epimerase
MHGLGNDFVIFEWEELQGVKDIASFSKRVCDRHFGVGADGVILVAPSDRAPFAMRIFNADGSEAEMCGNGIRCFAVYLWKRGRVADREFPVDTKAGIIVPQIKERNGKLAVRVNMGKPRLGASSIPINVDAEQVVDYPLQVGGKTFLLTAVSMGNPHAVIFDLPEEWGKIGEKIEKHSLFPHKTNVEFVKVRNRKEALVKVWERGVGPTLACGTGACAVLVAGVLKGVLDRETQIHLPGGTLLVSWPDNQSDVFMEGPAEEVFEGKLSEEVLKVWK